MEITVYLLIAIVVICLFFLRKKEQKFNYESQFLREYFEIKRIENVQEKCDALKDWEKRVARILERRKDRTHDVQGNVVFISRQSQAK